MTSSQVSQLPSVRDMIQEHGLLAKKSLGQNFLCQANILSRIVRVAGALNQVSVLEVGPGPGGLTRAILDAGAIHLTSIEKDERFLPLLARVQAVSDERLTILSGDALQLVPQEVSATPLKIIANLPYNVGTALLTQWLANLHGIESLTLMFQKEVALRIVAEPRTKDYGRLSVLCQWLCNVGLAFDLPPSVFFPAPKVTSTVVHLVPKQLPAEEVKVLFPKVEKITAHAFGQRRKMLRSSLKNLVLEAQMEALMINPEARAEELTPEQFIALARGLVIDEHVC